MLSWASQQIERLSQQVAPPPEDGAGRFAYLVQRGDEAGAMGAVAGMDPVNTVVNAAKNVYPVHLACQHSMVRLVRLLMAQPGATLDVLDANGNTPVHYAAMSTHPNALECLQMLLRDYQGSVTRKNTHGRTPYDLATVNSVRQFLLPIQLQAETQHALDNGGVGLPPGIDLGGMRIHNSAMPPPPTIAMPAATTPPPAAAAAAAATTPVASAATPVPPMQPFGQPYPHRSVAQAPASMPGRADTGTSPPAPASGDQEGYARVGSSSAAIFSNGKSRNFVRPDGFHSSSSDINLQKKYGHHSIGTRNVAPPPSSGSSAPLPSGRSVSADNTEPNPFAAGHSLSAQRYGSLPPANQRYVSYGPTSPTPTTTAANPASAYQTYASAPRQATINTFMPQRQQHPSPHPSAANANGIQTPSQQPQNQQQEHQQPDAVSQAPSTPFMPPPPYSGQNDSASTPSQPSFNDLVSPAVATVGSEPRTPGSLFSPQSNADDPTTQLFTSPQPVTPALPSETVGAAQDALPEDWSEAHDPSSGQIYYYNSVTQETRWERPVAGEQAAPATSETTLQASESVGGLPEGWMEAHDPSSGSVYYYNSNTGETSWERPTASSASTTQELNQNDATAANAGVSSSSQPEWMEAQDSSTGQTYYFNTVTNETSWERPADYQKPEQETQSVPDPQSGVAENNSAAEPTAIVGLNDAAVTSQERQIERAQSAEELFGDTQAVEESKKDDPASPSAANEVGSTDQADLQHAPSAEELFSDVSPTEETQETKPVTPSTPTVSVPSAPISGISTASSAEELFNSPPAASSEPSVASPTAVVSPPSSANELFGTTPASTSADQDTPAGTEEHLSAADDPTVPQAESSVTVQEPAAFEPAVSAEAASADASADGADLFAAIGMPPPPFQTKK